MTGRTRVALFATTLALAMAFAPAASGEPEQGSDLTCVDSATLNFNPGLTPDNTAQEITGELKLGTSYDSASPCTSATGVDLQGATGEITGTGEMGCVAADADASEATGAASGTGFLIWDTGEKSLAEWTATTYGAAVVLSAKITEGPLAGAEIVQDGVPTGLSGNCAESPITSITLSGTVHFVQP